MPSLFTKIRLLVRGRKRAKPTPNAVQPQQDVENVQVDQGEGGQQETTVGVDAVDPTNNAAATLTDVESSHSVTRLCPVAPTSTLESLPAELRCQILSQISDLGDLRALVLASPVFYQQYLLDRTALLGQVLKTALGNYLVDAYTVQKSMSLYDSCDRHHPLQPDTIRLVIDDYVALRTAKPDVILQQCTEEDLLGMAVFYLSVARPLSSRCAALFLSHLDASLVVGDLSGTERIRLLRALYRFQIYCDLFGRGLHGRRPSTGIEWEEQLALFFCIFKPWEIEEIDCIYVLIRDTYDTIFDSIRWDFHRDHPKFSDWGRPNTPPGSWDLDDSFLRESLREGTASRGLQPFYKALRTNDHEQLVDHMQTYIIRAGTFVETILGWTNQYFRRQSYPLEGDQMEARGERLPFSGDTEDGPPLAWVIEWRGRYSNTYGDVLRDSLKAWGHVFWDSKRLIKSKGTDAAVRERERFSETY